MIQIEGTSPLNEDNSKDKKESLPPLPDVSSKIETMLGQNTLIPNDIPTEEDTKAQQNTDENLKSTQIKDEPTFEDKPSESDQNNNQEENNAKKDEKETEQTNDQNENDNNDKKNTELKDSNDINNNNNDENFEGEKETENADKNNEGNKTEHNEETIENTNDENKTDINNSNEELKDENKLEDITDNNNNENKDQNNDDDSNKEEDTNPLIQSHFSNKPISFFFNQVDPKEVEDALESLINHQTQPVEQLHDPVMQLINRKKLDALIERDYDLAEKYDQTAEILQKGGDDLLFERDERIRKSTMDDRADSISERRNNLQQKYDNKIEELKTERRTALENLQIQQENENESFKSKWRDPNFISKYKRPSPELLQLRYIEKKLALSKFYDEAKEKKIHADKQQKIEEKQTQFIIEKEMKKDFFRMKDAQLFQLKKVAEYYDSQIKSIELQRDKELKAIDYALKQVEIKKNTVPNRKLHSIPKELTMMNDKYTDTSSTAKMSPRTLAKLAKFRVEKKGKISVSPISESTFSKLIAAHPIVRPPSKFKVNNHPPSRLKKL